MSTKVRLSTTEENYLKAIYALEEKNTMVDNQSIAALLKNTPASVSDMLKRLTKKELIIYQPYRSIKLTEAGRRIALQIIRKHRLWETFLVNCLGFQWEQIHPVAEQLEHIDSDLLIERLDAYLGYPKFDPHGDPIPSPSGEITPQSGFLLTNAQKNDILIVVAVRNDEESFLSYLNKVNIAIGKEIRIIDKIPFDLSIEVAFDNKVINLSQRIASQIVVDYAQAHC